MKKIVMGLVACLTLAGSNLQCKEFAPWLNDEEKEYENTLDGIAEKAGFHLIGSGEMYSNGVINKLGSSSYFFVNSQKFTGKRSDEGRNGARVNDLRGDIGSFKDYRSNVCERSTPLATCKEEYKKDQQDRLDKDDKLKKTLVGHYKIHLMPKEKDLIPVFQTLIDALKNDDELCSLIYKFKIAPLYNVKKGEPYVIRNKLGDVMPLIVIYAAEGQDKVQLLLDKLIKIFKDFEGQDIAPRFNLKVNDLIFYAQGDGDYKKEPWLEYFDKDKNYALYTEDFVKKDEKQDYSLKF